MGDLFLLPFLSSPAERPVGFTPQQLRVPNLPCYGRVLGPRLPATPGASREPSRFADGEGKPLPPPPLAPPVAGGRAGAAHSRGVRVACAWREGRRGSGTRGR